MVHPRSERNEVAVRLHLFGMAGQVDNNLLLFLRQNRAAGQPFEEWLKMGLLN